MKQLSDFERVRIETLLQEGYSPYRISTILNRSPRCIYEEIKRGSYLELDSELREKMVYRFDVGSRIRVERSHNKGRSLAIGNNINLSDRLEDLIINHVLSPYAALEVCRKEGFDINICLTTLYSYIHKGTVFLNLCDKHLRHPGKHKQHDNNSPVALKNKHCRLIEERPDYINNRSTFGHWELDTVYGSQGSKDCLFVLTERLSLHELLFKQPHKSIDCCVSVLDFLEQKYQDRFHLFFKTITCDNGSEFLSPERMESSCIYPGKNRTIVYHCHPFRSCERGSNENQNRIIRYFIPKGSDIDIYEDDDIIFIQNYMNNLPRKIFKGRSSAEISAQFGFS